MTIFISTGIQSGDKNIPIWIIYTCISSVLCILGVCLVPAVDFIKKYRMRSKIKNNDALSSLEKNTLINSVDHDTSIEGSLGGAKLLNYGLSVSAGSMLITSIYKVLPRSNKQRSNIYISCGWVSGLVLSLCLNYIVHHYTNESLIHCAHSEGDQESDHSHNHHHTETEEEHDHIGIKHSHSLSNISKIKLSKLDEACNNLKRQNSPPILAKSKSYNNFSESIKCLENTIGYDLKNIDHYRSMVFKKNSSKTHTDNSAESRPLTNETINNYGSTDAETSSNTQRNHSLSHSIHPNFDDASGHSNELGMHSHRFETPFSKLFSIGLQTCIALSLHKLPEGLIIYFSNIERGDSINKDLDSAKGSSIFIALAIHNFIEGFAMCLPIYTAFASKTKAVVLISLLGGITQPLGAFIGYLIYNTYMKKQEDSNTGIIHWISENSEVVNILLMSVTSGFLFVISLQMLQTAIGFSDSHVHEHHEDDETDDSDETTGTDTLGHDFNESHHTFGTNCVKWACFGGFLVLISGIFS